MSRNTWNVIKVIGIVITILGVFLSVAFLIGLPKYSSSSTMLVNLFTCIVPCLAVGLLLLWLGSYNVKKKDKQGMPAGTTSAEKPAPAAVKPAPAAAKPVPAAAKPVTNLATSSSNLVSPFEEFAQRASQSPASISIRMTEFSKLVDAVRDGLRKAYPSLDSGEAFGHASGGFTLRCPNCGQYNNEIVPMLYLAGTGMMKNAVFGGPNVAALAQGRCPTCGGSTLIASFSPEKIKAQFEASKAEAAAAQGIAALEAACPGVPFLRNLTVSPNGGLACCIASNGIAAYESGTDQIKWSLTLPSVEASLCCFVGPERLLVLSDKQKDQPLIQLVNTANGSVVAEAEGPKAYYYNFEANPLSGVFFGESSYDMLLTIQTAGDRIESSTLKCGQIYSPGPKIGSDGKCYAIIHNNLYRLEGDQKTSVMKGSNCICFGAPSSIYLGGGYYDRSGESALQIGDLERGKISEIAWGNEPIDEIALAGSDRLLLANQISETTVGRFPNAVVSLLSLASGKKEWSLTIGDLKPWRSVILTCAPEEGWALIQTGKLLKLISLVDGKTMRILPKQPQEVIAAKWLPAQKLLCIARNADRNKPGTLEWYRL